MTERDFRPQNNGSFNELFKIPAFGRKLLIRGQGSVMDEHAVGSRR